MDIGGLFQYLNSEACITYFAALTPENRGATIEHIMTECPEFLEGAQAFVSDTNIIRQKLETKVGQMCKKLAAVAKPVKEAPVKDKGVEVFEGVEEPSFPEFDTEKGKHIGDGFYLKREDHRMKLTSPEWTVYY